MTAPSDFPGVDLATLTITIDDVRKAGFCARGARRWFGERGIPFNVFLRDGISAAELIGRGDAMAVRVVRRRIERDG